MTHARSDASHPPDTRIGRRQGGPGTWGISLALGTVVLLCSLSGCSRSAPPSSTSGDVEEARKSVFDPGLVAAAETRMWKAYYRLDRQLLLRELTGLVATQFDLTESDAEVVAHGFAAAATQFATTTGGYRQTVLPQLEAAYRQLRQRADLDFDASAAAHAELAWWEARRLPGRNSPPQVGSLIGKLYAILYGQVSPAFERAGTLRAEAAQLRDLGLPQPDWDQIEQRLRESYSLLAEALE